MKKRLFQVVMLTVLAVILCSTPAYAEPYRSHCVVGTCSEYAASGSYYCRYHICRVNNCSMRTSQKGGYCSVHACKYPGCSYQAWYTSGKYKGYCNSHAWEVSGKTQTVTQKKTYTKAYTKKKTYKTYDQKSVRSKMPDCDDYESYDDFMDDWDGRMPDGSDAEDYWENW